MEGELILEKIKRKIRTSRLKRMGVRYLVCPQCGIMRFQVKNEKGDSALVMITRDFEVVPVNPDNSLEGYDLNFFYCLGCSWKGGISKLKKFL